MNKIGIIGAGNMGSALLKGILDSGVDAPSVMVSDSDITKLEILVKQYGINTTAENSSVFAASDVAVLAIKPQIVEKVINSMEMPDKMPLIISVIAGVSTEKLLKLFDAKDRSKTHIIRAMPNFPAIIRKGATGLSAGRYASEEDMQIAEKIFRSVGTVHVVEEKLINAVTAVSGSGPAYFLIIIEALADAGVKAGLPRNVALDLAVNTAIGSAHMIQETGIHPAALKDMVTSPAGTTIAALSVLEDYKVRAAMINAVDAALQRASKLDDIN